MKVTDNLHGETIKKCFVNNNHSYNLCFESELLVPISILYFKDKFPKFEIQNLLL